MHTNRLVFNVGLMGVGCVWGALSKLHLAVSPHCVNFNHDIKLNRRFEDLERVGSGDLNHS